LLRVAEDFDFEPPLLRVAEDRDRELLVLLLVEDLEPLLRVADDRERELLVPLLVDDLELPPRVADDREREPLVPLLVEDLELLPRVADDRERELLVPLLVDDLELSPRVADDRERELLVPLLVDDLELSPRVAVERVGEPLLLRVADDLDPELFRSTLGLTGSRWELPRAVERVVELLPRSVPEREPRVTVPPRLVLVRELLLYSLVWPRLREERTILGVCLDTVWVPVRTFEIRTRFTSPPSRVVRVPRRTVRVADRRRLVSGLRMTWVKRLPSRSRRSTLMRRVVIWRLPPENLTRRSGYTLSRFTIRVEET
jgi:hypothetical protein